MLRRFILVIAVLSFAGLVVACARPATRGVDVVRLQLKWVPQAQFAGYYAAKTLGYYRDETLDVTFLAGGPDVVPEDVVADGRAEIGITWLSHLLVAREGGLPLVNVAQIFAHSGLRQLALTASGIRGPADLRGRTVAVWPGHQPSLLAALAKNGVELREITLVPQPLGMDFFVKRKVDSAAAMTYNELREVQELGVRPDQLVVIDFNKEGTATLEDGLFARADWLRSPDHVRVAARFLRASLRGWEFCRDRTSDCLDILLREARGLERPHQMWMLSEVIKLIYGPPAPAGPVGRMHADAFAQTAGILQRHGVIKRRADAAAYTDAVWQEAQRR